MGSSLNAFLVFFPQKSTPKINNNLTTVFEVNVEETVTTEMCIYFWRQIQTQVNMFLFEIQSTGIVAVFHVMIIEHVALICNMLSKRKYRVPNSNKVWYWVYFSLQPAAYFIWYYLIAARTILCTCGAKIYQHSWKSMLCISGYYSQTIIFFTCTTDISEQNQSYSFSQKCLHSGIASELYDSLVFF